MRRLKTGRRPPIYPKTPGHLPCSSLTHPLPLSSRRPSVSFGGFGLKRKNPPPVGSGSASSTITSHHLALTGGATARGVSASPGQLLPSILPLAARHRQRAILKCATLGPLCCIAGSTESTTSSIGTISNESAVPARCVASLTLSDSLLSACRYLAEPLTLWSRAILSPAAFGQSPLPGAPRWAG